MGEGGRAGAAHGREMSHHSAVFKREGNGSYPRHVTRDRDDHSGGAWKGAQTIKDIRSRSTRMGTYDEQLRRIGE